MPHMPACSIDLLASARVPANANEWTALLAGSFPNPVNAWGFQDASGNIADLIAANNLTASGGQTYGQSAIGWTRSCVRQGISNTIGGSSALGVDISTTSILLLVVFRLDTSAGGQTATTDLLVVGTGGTNKVSITTAGYLQMVNGANTATGASNMLGTSPIVVLKIDRSIPQMVLYNTRLETMKPTWANPSSSQNLTFGGGSNNFPNAGLLYAALWTGANAEQPDATVKSLIWRVQQGHG